MEILEMFLFLLLQTICVVNTFDVRGTIQFTDNKPESFPENSWLVVKLEDVSRSDAPSIILGSSVNQITDYPNSRLSYEIKNVNRTNAEVVTVSAVINVGWKASGDDWVKVGDYITDTQNWIDFSGNENSYVKDIPVRLYK